MNSNNSDRPPIDSPEFEEWLRKRCQKYRDENIGNDSADFDERDLASGDLNDFTKVMLNFFQTKLRSTLRRNVEKLLKFTLKKNLRKKNSALNS